MHWIWSGLNFLHFIGGFYVCKLYFYCFYDGCYADSNFEHIYHSFSFLVLEMKSFYLTIFILAIGSSVFAEKNGDYELYENEIAGLDLESTEQIDLVSGPKKAVIEEVPVVQDGGDRYQGCLEEDLSKLSNETEALRVRFSSLEKRYCDFRYYVSVVITLFSYILLVILTVTIGFCFGP